MAIFRTDKERQSEANRVIERVGLFKDLDDVTGRVHRLFAEAHRGLVAMIEGADKTDADKGDDEKDAEAKQEEAINEATRLYRWAYNQLSAWVTPDWNAYVSDEQIAAARERLFPMGNPKVIAISQQLALESVSHLIAALKQEKVAKYPQTFFEELTRARENLVATVAAIHIEPKEPQEITDMHRKARALWDRRYAALQDITGGMLRLKERFEDLDRFFGPAKKQEEEKAETEAEVAEAKAEAAAEEA
ncbi:MAG: hypothetical protein JRH20_24720 [Deltaproteobacteria bacterium]|nr:hypothetical protein [Deltaproteobacteria bacterium]